MSDGPRHVGGAVPLRGSGVRGLTLLVALGLVSTMPPYLGPPLGLDLNVSSDLELVDHVVPGAAVALFAGLALLCARAQAGGSALAFVLVGCCFLAALFQAVSHVPLLLDAGTPIAPWGPTLLHAIPGFLITALALSLLLRLGRRQPDPKV